MTVNEKRIFNEIIVESVWQDYLVKELNKKWNEGRNNIVNKSIHSKSDHTSQGIKATIPFANIATSTGGPWNYKNIGGKDYPQSQWDEWERIKNGMNGLIFKKTDNKCVKYNNGVSNEYLSEGVVCSGDNRVEKNMSGISVQALYREDVDKYIVLMKYDSILRGEKNKIIGRVVRSAYDIVKNVCEGEDGLINFIITGYLGMHEYSSSIVDNREIVDGRYVNGGGSGDNRWFRGWYYGGYWRWYGNDSGNCYHFPYKANNYSSWIEDLNYYTYENRKIVNCNKHSNLNYNNLKIVEPLKNSDDALKEFFGTTSINVV